MKLFCNLENVTSPTRGRTELLFSVKSSSLDLNEFIERPCLLDISHPEKKKSIWQNKYYWELIGRLAPVLRISSTMLHNRMLRDYGVIETINDMPVTVELDDTEEIEQLTLKDSKVHLKPTSQLKCSEQGNKRVYLLLRGSSTYTVKEMSRLIDGLVSECQELGIPTETPAELERIEHGWYL